MSEVNDISAPGSGNGKKQSIPEEQLMAYLEGRLSAGQQYEVEQWLANEGMESDALDGLGQIKPEETKQMVNNLNHKLHKTLTSKKRKRKALPTNQYTLIAIVTILLLTIVAFIIISLSK